MADGSFASQGAWREQMTDIEVRSADGADLDVSIGIEAGGAGVPEAASADGTVTPVTIPIALAPGVTVRFATRLGGASIGAWGNCNFGRKVGDDQQAVAENLRGLARLLGAPVRLVHQVHSAIAIDAGAAADDGIDTYAVDADAQATDHEGLPLGILGADCLPVMYADAQAGVIGASHCGRRGLQRGVVHSCVEQMVALGADRAHIRAVLGPCICGDCYEVGDEIAAEFDAQFPGTRTVTRFGGAGIDIAAAALQALAAEGIGEGQVVSAKPRVDAATKYLEDDPELMALCASDGEGAPELADRLGALSHSMCTVENPLWYSHRRAYLAHKDHEGRFLAVVTRGEASGVC